jgi:hypothetical protein
MGRHFITSDPLWPQGRTTCLRRIGVGVGVGVGDQSRARQKSVTPTATDFIGETSQVGARTRSSHATAKTLPSQLTGPAKHA